MKNIYLLLLILVSTNSYAQVAYVNPGSNSGTVTVTASSSFTTRILPNRSVYCRAKNTTPNSDIGFFSNVVPLFLENTITGNLVGDTEAGIESSLGSDDAIAFIANEEVGEPNSAYAYSISISGTNPGSLNTIIECYETTFYGNFNTVTAANPYNYLELSNDSTKSLTARIRVIKNDGTVLSTINTTIGGGQQKDISIHDIAGAANTFGRIQVAHNGSLHALRAKITKYTSSFAITASDKLETRENSL